MREINVNLDEVIVYIRELLPLSRAELLKIINYDGSAKYKDTIKKNDIITDIIEQKFNPRAKIRAQKISNYKDIRCG